MTVAAVSDTAVATRAHSGSSTGESVSVGCVVVAEDDTALRELLATVRERAPNVPVIAMTACGSADSAVRVVRAGESTSAFDSVTKPVATAELLHAIGRGVRDSPRLREANRVAALVAQASQQLLRCAMWNARMGSRSCVAPTATSLVRPRFSVTTERRSTASSWTTRRSPS